MTEGPGPRPNYIAHIPPEILTPDEVDTTLGTLAFLDGAPLPETAEKAYDFLDTMRGVDAFPVARGTRMGRSSLRHDIHSAARGTAVLVACKGEAVKSRWI